MRFSLTFVVGALLYAQSCICAPLLSARDAAEIAAVELENPTILNERTIGTATSQDVGQLEDPAVLNA